LSRYYYPPHRQFKHCEHRFSLATNIGSFRAWPKALLGPIHLASKQMPSSALLECSMHHLPSVCRIDGTGGVPMTRCNLFAMIVIAIPAFMAAQGSPTPTYPSQQRMAADNENDLVQRREHRTE